MMFRAFMFADDPSRSGFFRTWVRFGRPIGGGGIIIGTAAEIMTPGVHEFFPFVGREAGKFHFETFPEFFAPPGVSWPVGSNAAEEDVAKQEESDTLPESDDRTVEKVRN